MYILHMKNPKLPIKAIVLLLIATLTLPITIIFYFSNILNISLQDLTVVWYEADGKSIKEQICVIGGRSTPKASQPNADPQNQGSSKAK